MAKLKPLYIRDPLLFKVSMVYLVVGFTIIILHRLNLLNVQPLGLYIGVFTMAYSYFYVGRRFSQISRPPKVSAVQCLSNFLDDPWAGAHIVLVILSIPVIFLILLSTLVRLDIL